MTAFVRFWILLSALLVAAGWILSAVHQLNRTGYLVVFAFAGIAFVVLKRKYGTPTRGGLRIFLYKFLQRCLRPAPLLFLVLVVLSLLSGLLYAGLNWDANAYRLPRILHWIGAEQWHWIHAADPRLNVAGCGFEWLAAPLLMFTGTDRFLFLINWTAYLLLPGLIFSVFARLQVRPKVAWWWMWFCSASWCFALQASSIANDAFAAIYILAAVDLALRAQTENRPADFCLSLFAVALATGVKQTNVPLVLLWLAAAWPGWRFLRRQPAVAILIVGLGTLISIVPISLANLHYAGCLLPMQYPGVGNFALNPFWGIMGNTIAIPAQNFLPPFYHLLPPYAGDWGDVGAALQTTFLRSGFGQHFSSFEHFLLLDHGSGVTETNAGFGLGGCVLLLLGAREAWRHRTAEAPMICNRRLWCLRALPWGLLLLFMATVGSYENARQLTPYYPFLLPALLVQRGQSLTVRQRRWQRLGLAVMGLTAIMIVVSADRPLFPAQYFFSWLSKELPESKIVRIERNIYQGSYFRSFEARRQALPQLLPHGEPVVGFYAGSSGVDEFAAWRPFGGRRVERVSPGEPLDSLQARGIRYVIVPDMALRETGETPADWMKKYRAILTAAFPPGPPTKLNRIGCIFYSFRVGMSAPTATTEIGAGKY